MCDKRPQNLEVEKRFVVLCRTLTEPQKRSIRLDDEVMDAIAALPGKTTNDKLRAALIDSQSPVTRDSPSILETLDLVRSLPGIEDIEMVIDAVMQRKIDERAALSRPAPGGYNPVSVPGVRTGYPPPSSMRNISGEMVPTTRENGDKIPYAEQVETAKRQHAEREASKDVAAQATGRDDVEYDANWGA